MLLPTLFKDIIIHKRNDSVNWWQKTSNLDDLCTESFVCDLFHSYSLFVTKSFVHNYNCSRYLSLVIIGFFICKFIKKGIFVVDWFCVNSKGLQNIIVEGWLDWNILPLKLMVSVELDSLFCVNTLFFWVHFIWVNISLVII